MFFCTVFLLVCSQVLPVIGLSSIDIHSYGIVRAGIRRPYVEGARIMLDGSEFIPIGVIKGYSIIYDEPNSPMPTNWPDETEGVYNLLNDPSTSDRETKFNVVTLAENRWLWENDPNYIPALHDLVRMCEDRGLYIIIRFQDWWQPWPPTPHFTWQDKVNVIVELNGWRDHVISIAKEFKDDQAVIGIDPLNEPPPPNVGWPTENYTSAQAQQIWRDNALQVIDAIHSVDPTYLIFIPPILGYCSLKDAIPWNRPNIVYTVHWYYGWDTEWGNAYADAYWNATTEQDFQYAYSIMANHYQSNLLDFRDQYNVPVMNSETSMCKLSYRTGNPCNNTEREFADQIRLGAERHFGQLYWQDDRNNDEKFWGLVEIGIPETWSVGGLAVKDAVDKYY
jgi:hypothetical protein